MARTFGRPTAQRRDNGAGGGDGDDVCCVCLAALVRQREGAGCDRPGLRWESQSAAAAVIVRLPCRHRMHRDCLAPWVIQQAVLRCPVCRQQAMLPDARAVGSVVAAASPRHVSRVSTTSDRSNAGFDSRVDSRVQ